MISFASAHESEVLRRARGRYYWLMFGGAVLLTGIATAFPSFGLVPVLLLPLVQTFTVERSTLKYKEHFGLLHGLINDFYGSLLFLLLVLTLGVLSTVVPGVGGLISAALFAVYWFVNESYCRRHFQQVARGQMPSILEMAGVGGTFAVVLLPPLGILVAVLWSYYAGALPEVAGG